FFQAEDGIRDLTVTGVQTCALPIFGLQVGKIGAALARALGIAALRHEAFDDAMEDQAVIEMPRDQRLDPLDRVRRLVGPQQDLRSEERRVGKEWRGRGASESEKKEQ